MRKEGRKFNAEEVVDVQRRQEIDHRHGALYRTTETKKILPNTGTQPRPHLSTQKYTELICGYDKAHVTMS